MGCCKSTIAEKPPVLTQQQEPPPAIEDSSPKLAHIKISTSTFVKVKKGRLEKVYELIQKLGDGER